MSPTEKATRPREKAKASLVAEQKETKEQWPGIQPRSLLNHSRKNRKHLSHSNRQPDPTHSTTPLQHPTQNYRQPQQDYHEPQLSTVNVVVVVVVRDVGEPPHLNQPTSGRLIVPAVFPKASSHTRTYRRWGGIYSPSVSPPLPPLDQKHYCIGGGGAPVYSSGTDCISKSFCTLRIAMVSGQVLVSGLKRWIIL